MNKLFNEKERKIVWIIYHLIGVQNLNTCQKFFHWKQHSQCNSREFFTGSSILSVIFTVILSVVFLSILWLWKCGVILEFSLFFPVYPLGIVYFYLFLYLPVYPHWHSILSHNFLPIFFPVYPPWRSIFFY